MLTKAEIARIRGLQEKKGRESAGHFVVEGEKVIRELLAARYVFSELFTTDEKVNVDASATAVHRIEAADMARISHFPTPSPLLAIGMVKRESLRDGELNHGLSLALDGVQDAGNVGTLIRIADWYKIDRVLLSPDCADLYSQKVINASMGSFARVRVLTYALAPVLTGAKVPVLGCDLVGESVHQLAALKDAVVVIGSEGRGISPEVKACINKTITIPRYGAAESLNAAIAGAIVCDNLRRLQRS